MMVSKYYFKKLIGLFIGMNVIVCDDRDLYYNSFCLFYFLFFNLIFVIRDLINVFE